jgi:hypothetical protein
MKTIMEGWKRFVTEQADDPRAEGSWLVSLGLSRVDHERLGNVGGSVPELGPETQRKTWNINNDVLAVADAEGNHWFKRPHRAHQLDRAVEELKAAGYQLSEDLPVPVWRPSPHES